MWRLVSADRQAAAVKRFNFKNKYTWLVGDIPSANFRLCKSEQ
ncbi:hypothetical protein D515_02736 [Grimontia indica]|uniref:Uncharacterized protein n=1 Tax=Grimontia indica TaxID=1056512 RepID=R1GR66_9GAMM|nr:hypothetical protein D515_02736 [Grimontia indica]